MNTPTTKREELEYISRSFKYASPWVKAFLKGSFVLRKDLVFEYFVSIMRRRLSPDTPVQFVAFAEGYMSVFGKEFVK